MRIILLLMISLSLAVSGCGTTATPSNSTVSAPANLTAVAQNFPKQVTLTWNTVSEAVKYNVYYSTSPGVTPANSAAVTVVMTVLRW